ncbi:hypothetical protein [Longimicrobium sp.]|jgi:hypothetical protein|uniref:hypothetical protein n=1 Tax=Longimicrobium sp. TaxID=2029185 RepID=UPI002ED9E112
MKKQYPTVLRGDDTGRLNREEVVAAIIRVRAAKDAAAAAKRREAAEARKAVKAQKRRGPEERS